MKKGVLNANGIWEAVIPPHAADSGKSPARGLGKFDFYCSKSHRPAYYLLTFLVEFKAV